jgi:hypothetical protein
VLPSPPPTPDPHCTPERVRRTPDPFVTSPCDACRKTVAVRPTPSPLRSKVRLLLFVLGKPFERMVERMVERLLQIRRCPAQTLTEKSGFNFFRNGLLFFMAYELVL